jgi:hypothetical protein
MFSIEQKYDLDGIIVIFIKAKTLFMENKFKITIPKPCHEDWNAMTPEESGRFCSVCTKGVVDFTNKTSDEIQHYFIENQGQKICGRFKNEQMNKVSIPIPKSVFEKQLSFHKAFLLILFIVMGSTLFSCKNHNNDYVTGEPVVVEDTVQVSHTMGKPMPPKEVDSIEKRKDSSPTSADKNAREKPSQDNLPKATLGITVVKPIVDSTKTKKK